MKMGICIELHLAFANKQHIGTCIFILYLHCVNFHTAVVQKHSPVTWILLHLARRYRSSRCIGTHSAPAWQLEPWTCCKWKTKLPVIATRPQRKMNWSRWIWLKRTNTIINQIWERLENYKVCLIYCWRKQSNFVSDWKITSVLDLLGIMDKFPQHSNECWL